MALVVKEVSVAKTLHVSQFRINQCNCLIECSYINTIKYILIYRLVCWIKQCRHLYFPGLLNIIITHILIYRIIYVRDVIYSYCYLLCQESTPLVCIIIMVTCYRKWCACFLLFVNRVEAAKRLCYLFLAEYINGNPLFGRHLAVFN